LTNIGEGFVPIAEDHAALANSLEASANLAGPSLVGIFIEVTGFLAQ
jgi:hypothetical protein